LSAAVDPADYRRVLGNFPTGVAVITAHTPDDGDVGMVVGSFTSVSLDPPLVAFLPMKTSGSYRKLAGSKTFCVNFLGAHQEALCRLFASKVPDKFSGLDYGRAPSGSPIIPDVIGWVDCEVEAVHDAGDHDIVIGRVVALSGGSAVPPLVFFRGGYGRFSTSSLIAGEAPDLLAHLKLADIARQHIETLSEKLRLAVSVTVRSGNEIVILASAGAVTTSRVGERLPFAPPMGAVLVAWEPPAVTKAWLANLGASDAGLIEHHAAALERVRERGWSIGLDRSRQRQLQAAMADALRQGHAENALASLRRTLADVAMTHDPDVIEGPNGRIGLAVISAPVRRPDGQVAMGISLTGFDDDVDPYAFEAIRDVLLATAGRIEQAIAPFLSGAASQS